MSVVILSHPLQYGQFHKEVGGFKMEDNYNLLLLAFAWFSLAYG